MVSPVAIAFLTKKALKVAQDKRIQILFGSIIVGLITIIVVPLLAMVSIWNTEAGYSREIARIVLEGGPIPTDIDEELSRYMEEMIQAFEKIDTAIDELNEEGFDDIKVKSFFYILYFSEDLTAFDDEYYKGFVDFFVDIEDDEKIYSSLNEYSPSAIGELNKKAYV